MSIVLLISETTLKKYTVVNDNVDAAYITPSIVKAQEIGLQPLIGSVLHLYFDLFSGFLQMYLFIMLTMVFTGTRVPEKATPSVQPTTEGE